MAKGSKKKYTSKQKRQAEHNEEGYKDRGESSEEAERKAWATVSKSSGSGKKTKKASSKKGGRKGGAAKKRKATKKGGRKKTRGARKKGGRKKKR